MPTDIKPFKPTFEVVEPNIGSSFTFYNFPRNGNIKTNYWHYHPEIEIIYINGGSGKRQIGSSISYFQDGDLVLIGSNLPHCGMTNEYTNNNYEIIVQFKPDFLGSLFWEVPEMSKISRLLEISKSGVVFGDKTKKEIEIKLKELQKGKSVKKLMKLLEILEFLSLANDIEILNAGNYNLQAQVEDNDRMNVLFNYVKDHFKETITLDEMSNLANMTIPSFCRYFKKVTNKTFTQFVSEYRVVHAMKLLVENPMTITEISYECGFNNFSHFTKTFKDYTGKSPSNYRKEFRSIIH